MKRREFIMLLGGAAVAWPLVARAQQAGTLPTIGFFGPNTASAWRPWTAAFVQRLHELGWIEGRNLAIEYRWADARSERFAEIAAEFVRLKVDVIVTGGNAAVAAKQVSSVVPIVFALVDDPVSMGLAASLARPGNIGCRRSVMHAVMRSYSGKGTKALFDLLEKNKGEVESLIRGVKGFVSYSLVRTTRGGFSVSVYEDKAGADESSRAAREWIAKNASKTGVARPIILEGTVMLQLK